MTPQAAPETPQPMTPYQDQYQDPPSMAAPSPAPSHGGAESFEPHETAAPATGDLDESVSYEPEAKRFRTASAEEELKDVEAGKGTAACIKYTQVSFEESTASRSSNASIIADES